MSSATAPLADVLPQRRTPCLARLDRARTWSPTMAVTVGGRHIGVRTSGDPAAVRLLARGLATVREPALDAFVPPNFSVEFGRTGDTSRGLHLVYRDHEVVARRRSADRLVQDVIALLCEAGQTDRADLLLVQAVAVVHEGGATLLPVSWHRRLLLHQERLHDGTTRMLTPMVHGVDGRTGDLVHDAGLDGTLHARTAIRSWVVRTAEPEPRLRPGPAIQALFPSVVNVDLFGPGAALRAVAALATAVPCSGIGAVPDAQLLELTRLLACQRRTPGG